MTRAMHLTAALADRHTVNTVTAGVTATPAAAPAPPRTVCQSHPEIFDADGLTESGDRQSDREEAVSGTLDAIEACTHCPLLAACRRSTQADIDRGISPRHTVRAGIFWGPGGHPDPTLAGALTDESSRLLAAECRDAERPTVTDHDGETHPASIAIRRSHNISDSQGVIDDGDPLLPVTIPDDRFIIGWDASWVQLRDIHTGNPRAVALALSDSPDDWAKLVTQFHLDESRDTADGREVADDVDVCVIIRTAIDRGITRRKLAARLAVGATRLEEIMIALGLPVIRDHAKAAARQKGLARRRRNAEHDTTRNATDPGHADTGYPVVTDAEGGELPGQFRMF
jgi:hypothetical protein